MQYNLSTPLPKIRGFATERKEKGDNLNELVLVGSDNLNELVLVGDRPISIT